MSSLHPPGAQGPIEPQAMHTCARQGCPVCMEQLLRQHEPLVHLVVQSQVRGEVPYGDLVQEGRFALWRAIRGFDPTRGTSFSAYAGTAIRHRIWLITFRARRQCPPRAVLERLAADVAAYADAEDPYSGADPAELLERREPARLLLAAVRRTCDRSCALWERALLAYGLDGAPVQSLAAVGRRWGVTREYLRQCREAILVRLRVQLVIGPFLAACGRDTRATYQRFQALNRAARRQRRRRAPAKARRSA